MTETWETSVVREVWASQTRPGVVFRTVVGVDNNEGTSDHSVLTNRAAADQHPIGAVTGLQVALDGKVSTSDQRLSDARTPTAHKVSHATGGTDPLTPADIGAAEETHDHAASAITSGVIDTARLGTGTADATTVLHGDGTWGAAAVFPMFAFPPVGGYTPVYSIGEYADFTYWNAIFLTPLIALRDMTVDRVSVQVWTAAAGSSITTVLYSWDGSTATKVAELGDISSSSMGFSEQSFAPLPIDAGIYVVASKPNVGNPKVSGMNGPVLGFRQGAPNAGAAALWGSELVHYGTVNQASFLIGDVIAGRKTPRVVLRRSA